MSNMNQKPVPVQEVTDRLISKLENSSIESFYELKIKQKLDVDQQIQGLENEIKQEMAQALKKTEDKLLYKIYVLKQAKQNIEEVQIHKYSKNDVQFQSIIQDYDDLRKQTESAIRDLIIHRQSLGFTINNHKLVRETYKIPGKLNI